MKTVRTIFLFVSKAFLVVSFTSCNTGRQDNKVAFSFRGESSSFVESDQGIYWVSYVSNDAGTADVLYQFL